MARDGHAGTFAGSSRAPAPREHTTMNSVTHEHVASELARAYIDGDDNTRRHIAATCEEQGILAALVVLAIPETERSQFIRDMHAVLVDP